MEVIVIYDSRKSIRTPSFLTKITTEYMKVQETKVAQNESSLRLLSSFPVIYNSRRNISLSLGMREQAWSSSDCSVVGKVVVSLSRGLGPYALPGVINDRRGWQWPPWWFQTLLIIILSNVCFLNFLVLCSYLGQEWRGPCALPGVIEDRRGWQWSPWWFLT